MPSRYPVEVRRQVVELARAGTKVSQLAETFGMTQASIYSWLKQDRIDRGEAPGLNTEGQMELAAAKRRIRPSSAPRQCSPCSRQTSLIDRSPRRPPSTILIFCWAVNVR